MTSRILNKNKLTFVKASCFIKFIIFKRNSDLYFLVKTFPESFLLFVSAFSIQLKIDQSYQWLNSNRGSLLSEATALPTEPQPLPKPQPLPDLTTFVTRYILNIPKPSHQSYALLLVRSFSWSFSLMGCKYFRVDLFSVVTCINIESCKYGHFRFQRRPKHFLRLPASGIISFLKPSRL